MESYVSVSSNIEEEDAKKLIGKIIATIEAYEYEFKIVFTDGASLTLSGARWGESPLGVDYEDGK